jgi:hypothetical protein
MHIRKFGQTLAVILHRHVSVTPVTFIRVQYNKSTVTTQTTVHIYMTEPLTVTLNVLKLTLWSYK